MEIAIPLSAGVSFKIATDFTSGEGYPTARLQKGFLLVHNGLDLAEEGVGFGVPVLKRGMRTIFPGDVELDSFLRGSLQGIRANFKLNLEEKFTRSGSRRVESKLFYTMKNILVTIFRPLPPFHGLVTAVSNTTRRLFGWKTFFEEASFSTDVMVIYTIDSQAGILNVEVNTVDLSRDGVTEIVVMNEQGAHYFDRYRDSSGILLHGNEIGGWNKVTAQQASFLDEMHQMAFTLQQVKGAVLMRGREAVGSRLAWSGFGYSFPPTLTSMNYEVKIERLS